MTTIQKRHLENEFALFQTSSILFSFICLMLAKFSGLESERTVSEFRKRKEKFCAVFTNSIERVSEIRKFHVAIVERALTNVQKSVMHVQSCCFASMNLLDF